MTLELTMLLYSLILAFALALAPVLPLMQQNGMARMAGNRENLPEPNETVKRLMRARDNHFEWLPIFAGLVLIANLAGVSNANTILGAQLFFWGRVAHAVLYAIGVPWVRTLAWLVSIIGMVMIALELL